VHLSRLVASLYAARVPRSSPERFDASFYRRFYIDPRTRVVTRAEMARRADLVAAFVRHGELRVRTILDVGCGLGLMRAALRRHFPRARYTGLEPSPYLCERYGWQQGSAADFESPRPFDLVICYDVLQYLTAREAAAALRNLATTYPYETHDDNEVALRSDPQQIAGALRTEIQARLDKAGVEVIEARISHLAYAPEIANAMLRRQQASAIIAARTQIVEGAVSMVDMALEQLARKQVIELDEERKAAMVSNLLVVLCGEQEAQPVLNTGSLYT